MNKLSDEVEALLNKLFDPQNKTTDTEEVLAELNQMLVDQEAINKENKPKNKEAACIYIATQSADISARDLEYFMTKYYRSINLARTVARHPNLPIHWLAKMMVFLPEDAKANPSYEKHSQDEKWQNLINQVPASAKSRYKYSSGRVFDFIVDQDRPDYFKLDYWFKNGQAADRIYLVGLGKIREELLHPYTKDASAHVRKKLANRKNISKQLSFELVNDKAKTVREALANNPHCAPLALTQLSKDDEAIVKVAALANKACPIDAIHAAKLAEQMKPKPAAKPAKDLNEQEIIKQLAQKTLAQNTLKTFSKMSQPFVRAAVALHANCDQSVLKKLSKDSELMVRQSVAYNPNAPVACLNQLMKEAALFPALAANPNLPEKQQLALVKVADEVTLLTLANTTESNSVWEALRDSEEPQTSKKKNSKKKTWRECLDICLNPKGKGLYALQRNRHSRHLFVNKLVARHPKCTDSLKAPFAFYLLESLMKNPKMALMMLENPNAIKPEEYAEWKLKDWFMYEEAPGHVVKYYLHSDEVKYARKAVICWTAQLVDIQAQIYHDDIHMKKYMAGLPNATSLMLEILARDSKESVRMAVVDNKHTPAEVLVHLATDKVAGIRTAAMNHKKFDAKKIPSGVTVKVESLKNKGPKRIRIKQAKDTESLVVLRDLAGDKVSDVRLAVIENQRCPKDVVDLLKDDEHAEIRKATTNHENSTLEICDYLLSDENERVRYSALRTVLYATAKQQKPEKGQQKDHRNRLFDEGLLLRFKDDSYEYARALVARLTTDEETQKQLASDESMKVREAVAANYFLDTEIAKNLIELGERRVVSMLAKSTPHQEVFLATLVHADAVASSLWRNSDLCEQLAVQQVLVKQEHPKIREVAAQFSKDKEVLGLCATDQNYEVRRVLCYNEHIQTAHVLKILEGADESMVGDLHSSSEKYLKKHANELSGHTNPAVRAYMANNYKLKAENLKRLISDENPAVRTALADSYGNQLNKEQIEQLRNDSNEGVRRAIKWRYD